MKLICSILILAGAFALNNASISYEDQMRLINDQQMLEDLKRASASNRDANTMKCSQDMMSSLNVVMTKYNNDVDLCNKTKEAEINKYTENAMKKAEGYGSSLGDLCALLSDCAQLSLAEDLLNCYGEKSGDGASLLSGVAADAATQSVELKKGIENAIGKKEVCETVAMQAYTKDREVIDKQFADCVSGKTTEAGGETTTTTTTTAAPTPEPTQPAEVTTPAAEGGEVQPEGRGRRPNAANKYRRF